MKSTVGSILLSIFVVAGTATAEVRDDYRTCEQDFLKRIPRGSSPQASNAAEEYCLGLGYWFQSSGNRLPHDPEKAAYWHSRAVEHGSSQARVALAYHYEKGHGVAVNLSKAVELYSSAADQGDVSAMFNLARLYSLGRGVPKNEAESQRWMQRAKSGGSSDAVVDERKTRQYNELESKARETFEAGHKAYQAKNYQEAVKLFNEAHNAGNVSAAVALGQLYNQGLGVTKDPQMATKLFREAADKGHARGQAQLGLSYELGEGVSENWAEAINWYQKSAIQLDPLGLHYMGRAYQFGIGVAQDRAMAVVFYEKAENQGEQHAAFFAKWLRKPGNCLGYVDDAEREKFAGVCSDPKGIKFNSSTERRRWLTETMSRVKVDLFGSSSYMQSSCGAMGGNFMSGNCYGHGGVIVNPGTQDRYGNNLW